MSSGIATPTFPIGGVSAVLICHVLNVSIDELFCISVLVAHHFLSMLFIKELAFNDVIMHATLFNLNGVCLH